jgi:hypothetical protein
MTAFDREHDLLVEGHVVQVEIAGIVALLRHEHGIVVVRPLGIERRQGRTSTLIAWRVFAVPPR